MLWITKYYFTLRHCRWYLKIHFILINRLHLEHVAQLHFHCHWLSDQSQHPAAAAAAAAVDVSAPLLTPFQLFLISHYLKRNFPSVKVKSRDGVHRHIKWDQTGNTSNANFLETLDMKQKASPVHMLSFLEFVLGSIILIQNFTTDYQLTICWLLCSL